MYKSCFIIGDVTEKHAEYKIFHFKFAFIKRFLEKKCCFHIKFDNSEKKKNASR